MHRVVHNATALTEFVELDPLHLVDQKALASDRMTAEIIVGISWRHVEKIAAYRRRRLS